MLEPSPSLAHLQARQRLCWAALTHQRLGPSAGVLVGPLLARVGAVGPAVQPGQQVPEQVARSSTVRGGAWHAWHVARAARSLHQLPLCQGDSQPQAGQEPSDARAYRELADSLVSRMVGWHGRFGGQPSWAHFLNKTSFLHEMEEVLLPLRMCEPRPSPAYSQLRSEGNGVRAGCSRSAVRLARRASRWWTSAPARASWPCAWPTACSGATRGSSVW